ncbi:hypothetical protein FH972_009361 [Carpinus fangiana]|uniref:DUF2828 domain-containing protein n=1 Tax=Carpinus fangiana TaxID=176857 RepID=A0A5N6R1L9_9ROSI|nr:hypothetical protein FH972_009361 [Carpinus fangiana]
MNTTIRRTARSRWSVLRYICSALPGLPPSIFGLLGPPEVPRSTIFTVNSSYPDDTQDPFCDRLINNPRVLYKYKYNVPPEESCLVFCNSFICKETLLRKDNSPDILQYYLELSWSHCPQTTLKLICLLRSTGRFSKQRREDFYTVAVWLHRYHVLSNISIQRGGNFFHTILVLNTESFSVSVMGLIKLDESHYAYRIRNRLQKQVLVPLRRALELPEIYMSARQWNLIPYDRIASNVMKTYKRLFYKHDHNSSHDEIAELQWKRMLDSYSSKRKFVNCISVIDSSLFHVGYDCFERFCLSFALMTSELCVSPWRRKVLTYNLDNLEFVNIEGDDLGLRINFLRSLPTLCEYPNLIQLLDKILETAKDFSGWEENYGRMREKYERNGYTMPKIVYWSNWHWVNWVQQREGDITIIRTSEANFRNFLESNKTLSSMAMMESKIYGEDYLKLVVHD